MMMVLSALRPDASLPEFLAHRARSASLRRLQLDILAGGAIAGTAFFLRYSLAWLLFTAIGVVFLCYGAWGLADRGRQINSESANRFRAAALETSCAVLVAFGIVATAAILYAVWGLALGTWIS